MDFDFGPDFGPLNFDVPAFTPEFGGGLLDTSSLGDVFGGATGFDANLLGEYRSWLSEGNQGSLADFVATQQDEPQLSLEPETAAPAQIAQAAQALRPGPNTTPIQAGLLNIGGASAGAGLLNSKPAGSGFTIGGRGDAPMLSPTTIEPVGPVGAPTYPSLAPIQREVDARTPKLSFGEQIKAAEMMPPQDEPPGSLYAPGGVERFMAGWDRLHYPMGRGAPGDADYLPAPTAVAGKSDLPQLPPTFNEPPQSAIARAAPAPVAPPQALAYAGSPPNPPARPSGGGPFETEIQAASRATGVPAPLIRAQMMTESSGNPNAVGRAGEIGLMQVRPSTAADPGFGMKPVDPSTLRDPASNIMAGAQYLAARGRAAGVTNWEDPQQQAIALAAYNGTGPAAQAYAQRVMANIGAPLPRMAGRSLPLSGGSAPDMAMAFAPSARRSSDPRADMPAQGSSEAKGMMRSPYDIDTSGQDAGALQFAMAEGRNGPGLLSSLFGNAAPAQAGVDMPLPPARPVEYGGQAAPEPVTTGSVTPAAAAPVAPSSVPASVPAAQGGGMFAALQGDKGKEFFSHALQSLGAALAAPRGRGGEAFLATMQALEISAQGRAKTAQNQAALSLIMTQAGVDPQLAPVLASNPDAAKVALDLAREKREQTRRDQFSRSLPPLSEGGNVAPVTPVESAPLPAPSAQPTPQGSSQAAPAPQTQQAAPQQAQAQAASQPQTPAQKTIEQRLTNLMRLREQVTQRLLVAPDEQSRATANAYLTQIDKQLDDLRKSGDAPKTLSIKMPDQSERTFQWDADSKTFVPLRAPAAGTTGEGQTPVVKLTETQSKDLSFHNRGKAALADLGDGKELTSTPNAVGSSLPLVGNFAQSDAYREKNNAAREFLAAILRKDTGAAVTDKEFEMYGSIYLPRPGDDAKTIARKQEARERSIDAIRDGLGTAETLALGRRIRDRKEEAEAVTKKEEANRKKGAATPPPSRSDIEAEARRRGLIQ